MPSETIIGIDLDNTLVCYDEVFHFSACEERLIDPSMPRSKERIRDAIRLLPDGEAHWTRLQAIVYGPRMKMAQLFDGAEAFLRHCAATRVRTLIVSHKTKVATLDGVPVDLRQAALGWLKDTGFFTDFALSPGDVFFESTRADKIERICSQGCTHFIDDLVEVFAEGTFPRNVCKLLFAPHGTAHLPPDVRAYRSWQDIDRFFFP